jgi:cysteine desulfurase
MLPFLQSSWGNPSSLHRPGRQARRAVDSARRTIADLIGAAPDEIVFTASGSEGANLAIKGVATAGPRGGIVTSSVEHHAVHETCRWLAQQPGHHVTFIDVDSNALVDLDQLERSVTDDTALVSIIYANNEVGTIEPVAEILEIAHARGALVHTDAVQAVGALSLDVHALGVDLLSIAGHKFGAPKGIGALYVHRGVRLPPQIHGGGQEHGRRSGTENVPYIVGMAEALRITVAERDTTSTHLRPLSQRLLNELPTLIAGCRVTGHPTRRLPNHASFAFDGVEIASVLLGLDRQQIFASSGSACTSASSEPSHVLLAIGVPRTALYGALRLTLSRDNVGSDVDVLLAAIPPLVAAARGQAAVAA